jgi:hypothetical protein
MPGTTRGPEVGTTPRNHIVVIFALSRVAMAMIPPRRELKFTSKLPKVKFFFVVVVYAENNNTMFQVSRC